MIGTIATMVGYRTKPKATFVLKHPLKAMRMRRMRNRMRRTFGGSRALAMGVGAAALTIPVGIWLSRRGRTD